MHCLLLIVSFISLSVQALTTPYRAVVHEPIADLVGEPIEQFHLAPTTDQAYKKLPLSSAAKSSVCPRLHQLLFNEIVTVIDERGDEVMVEVPHVFYSTPGSQYAQNYFWMQKKVLTPLEEFQENHLPLALIPQCIDFMKKNILNANYNVVALWLPYTNPITGRQYSAGTRFVRAAQVRKKSNTFHVFEYDPEEMQFKILNIPKKYCFEVSKKYSQTERVQAYVSLLKTWAHTHTIIPFVWGGCSFQETCFTNTYEIEHTQTIDGQTKSFWRRPEMIHSVHSGFDISGLVLRAAQICGIPYYFKNSTTANMYLEEIHTANEIREGDLIWIPYGLFVISNLQEHKVIASMGYDPGYGRVVELPLHKLFKDVTTLKELMSKINNKKTITRLKADGSFSSSGNEYKILRIQTVWDY